VREKTEGVKTKILMLLLREGFTLGR
jgi:hypothetical protein